jgi:hypothetical protein
MARKGRCEIIMMHQEQLQGATGNFKTQDFYKYFQQWRNDWTSCITLQGKYIKCNSSCMQSSETNTIEKLCEHTTNTNTKKYTKHQLEHKAKQSPTSSAKVKKISNLPPLHSYTHVLHSMMFTHTHKRPT